MKIVKLKVVLAVSVSAGLLGLAGCAALMSGGEPTAQEVSSLLKASFSEKGSAQLDRLDQSELQLACSQYALESMPAEMKAKLEKMAELSIKYPEDGKYLGDWREGEKIAQNGRGLQFSDAKDAVAGGNCYACHEIDKKEVSYGNIGPSLAQYGKLRGSSDPIVKYTWARIWNSHTFNACNNMPRFGAAGILTEQQIKHVMALLLDPTSPVNQ
jgi:L-cysteine S-thiosulfotransferase